VCQRNKSVEFTLAFSLRSIFYRFLAGETTFPHQDAQTGSGPQPSFYSVDMGETLFSGGGDSGGRVDIRHHNPGANNEWRLPLLPA